MLTKIPEKYAEIAADWQADLKAWGDEGKKILWNFTNESRVKTGVRKKFLRNLSQKYKGGDPVAIIPECVEPDMIMQGPAPAGELPKRFARVVTLRSFIEFHLTRERFGRPVSQKLSETRQALRKVYSVIRAINDETIDEELREYIENERTGFIWIADAAGMEELYSKRTFDELRNLLGLYSDFDKKDIMVVMTFSGNLILPRTNGGKIPVLKIPTVMEGKDSCAFTPAEEKEKRSGYLIDLKSGNRTLPEWVCKRARTGPGFSIIKYLHTDPKRLELKTDPPNDFLRKYAKMIN